MTTHLHAGAIGLLIDRLDKCFKPIRNANDSELEQQAAIYARFLADLQADQIGLDAMEIQAMIELVEQFCRLVEEELVVIDMAWKLGHLDEQSSLRP